jgi:ABC-2 type transport system ATP-binding protein
MDQSMVKQLMPENKKNDPIIQARGLTRRFGSLTAVDKLDIDIYLSEVFGFLGPNGAGKSTLLRMLVGLMPPSDGTAQVLGFNLPKDAEKLRSKIGYMTQKFSLYEDLSVEENLEFSAQIFGLDKKTKKMRIDEVLHDFDLEELRFRRPAVLSGGWKQRLALAVSMIHKPAILFLDEPTSGVDPSSRRLFWEKLFELASRGTTILVSTHYMDEAFRCHRICMLQDGRIKAVGSPAELTGSLKGRIIEITAEPIEKAMHTVRRQPYVASVTQLGSQAHVLLMSDAPSDKEASAQLYKVLHASGFKQLKSEPAEPNLEDVFVAQTQKKVRDQGDSEI